MTCQDCIHHNVCYYAGRLKTKDSDGEKRIIAETNNVEDTCENFQDRSLLVKPPCKVGDAVYQFDNAGRIYESVVTKIIYDTPIISFDKNAIGVSVFLSREKAKQALEERESNDK